MKKLTDKQLDRAATRLLAGEVPLQVARIFGLRNANQLTTQLGEERWEQIKAVREGSRSGAVRKASSYSGKSSPLSNVFGKRY